MNIPDSKNSVNSATIAKYNYQKLSDFEASQIETYQYRSIFLCFVGYF